MSGQEQYTVIDLFCGAGGFSFGFEKGGFNILAGYDIEPKFQETFNLNHNNSLYIVGDLSEGIPKNINHPKIDVIIGSPPCQGFSDARGNRNPKNEKHELRNNLPIDYINIVQDIRPKIALMENVAGMSTFQCNNEKFIDILAHKFQEIGYDMCYDILNSAHFGVPQERKRVFCLAIDKEFEIVAPYLIKNDLENNFKSRKNFTTVFDAIGDLPKNPCLKETCNYIRELSECTEFQCKMRVNSDKVYNHVVVNRPNDDEKSLMKKLVEGKIYRSSRFGSRYMGVWELYADVFKEDERELLHFLCRKRTHKDFKEKDKKYEEGYLKLNKFPKDKEGKFYWQEEYPKNGKNTNRSPMEIIQGLLKNQWLREKEFKKNGKKFIAYDINTKSGIRPMYMRLSRKLPSRTIMTTSFRVRELVHPTEERALTLREGARIQSFPDEFIFPQNNKDTTIMIGNAVPPSMAQELAKYIKLILDFFEGKKDIKYRKVIDQFIRKRSKREINPKNTLMNYV